MKTILTAVILCAALSATAQTKAKGKIESSEPYYVHILHFGKDNVGEWIRWEPWEWYGEYDVKVEAGNRIRAMFISQCTGEVIARVEFSAGYNKEKIRKNIVLDGGSYEIGSLPDDSWTSEVPDP